MIGRGARFVARGGFPGKRKKHSRVACRIPLCSGAFSGGICSNCPHPLAAPFSASRARNSCKRAEFASSSQPDTRWHETCVALPHDRIARFDEAGKRA